MRLIVFRTPLNPFTGYGNDGLGLVRSLVRSGIDTYIDPQIGVTPPWPAQVAGLMTKENRPPFDVVINHWDPSNLELTGGIDSVSDLRIAWTMWEFTTLDNLPAPARRTLAKRLRSFDLVLCYDFVTQQALQPYADRAGCATAVLQGGYFPEDWPEIPDRTWAEGEPFRFIMVGALNQRKDPFVAINAFTELKEEHGDAFADAELHLKTNIRSLHPRLEEMVPKCRVHYAVWSQAQIFDLYRNSHCLLAPSRGEGKNMPALEMLSTGGTVIATNHGGHTMWLSEDFAYPLDFTLAPTDPKWPDCLEARPSKEHLKELMWHVYTHRAEAADKGRQAAKAIPLMAGWDSVVERLWDVVGDAHPKGADARVLARAARRAVVPAAER